MTTIHTILIANRGEIARRIQRTASAMGIRVVAVYADGDAGAPHVREADVAIPLHGRTAAETYLDIDKLLGAARLAGADAIHPGYGFLSENAAFARAVEAAGLVWIGPPPEAIEIMGDKLAAKRMMDAAGVPTLPSVEVRPGEDAAPAALRVGYPILVKAAGGGGGKGMRIVDTPEALSEAIEGAAREAGAAFGNDTVFLERYIPVSRHIEVQILGDRHDAMVHCFERECSIQRRHQKILEEAPSPVVDAQMRALLGEAALKAARAVNYSSAGTVEFLVEGRDFWFLEMNTRLQVEHPVTEEICGIDLVREQIDIACGKPLRFEQADLAIGGHAIEVRIYAEDPATGFLPATGEIVAWQPAPTPSLRIESGVEAGSVVGIEFDPMLAKIIVHAATREEAAARLALGLERLDIRGLPNNRDFLVQLLRSPAFLAGDTTTDFIARTGIATATVLPPDMPRDAAILASLAGQRARADKPRPLSTLPVGWRNTPMPPEQAIFEIGDRTVALSYSMMRDGQIDVHVGGSPVRVRALAAPVDRIVAEIEGVRRTADVAWRDGVWHLALDGHDIAVRERPRFENAGDDVGGGALTAPMPGSVVSVQVEVGATVRRGDNLMLLEAMKMEHRIVAPVDGIVTELRVDAGMQVARGDLLAVLTPEDRA
ncbi:MAG: biotin carboxylase N-terminal domain-containing protein [Sphingobium sp.]